MKLVASPFVLVSFSWDSEYDVYLTSETRDHLHQAITKIGNRRMNQGIGESGNKEMVSDIGCPIWESMFII